MALGAPNVYAAVADMARQRPGQVILEDATQQTLTYRRLMVGADVLAWSYEDPFPEVARLAGHLAFYQDVVDLRVGVADPAVSGR